MQENAMPFIEPICIANIEIHLWEIKEDEAFFIREIPSFDLLQLNQYRHPQARIQWLASRMMLNKILGTNSFNNLTKNEKGKLLLEKSNLKVSISHSDNLVAVVISEKQFGIDVQKYTDKIPLVSSKFIPEETLTSIKDLSNFEKICHVHWGIKEALFKADEQGSLDYRKNLILDWDNCFVEKGTNFTASIIKNDLISRFAAQYIVILQHFFLCSVTKL